MTFADRVNVRVLAIVALQVGLTILTACGGGSTTPTTGAVAIELFSSIASLTPGTSVDLTATVYDQHNQGVTWTIAPLHFGGLSHETSTNTPSSDQTMASVTYTAPTNFSTKTTVTITATSITNSQIQASIQLTVSPIAVVVLVNLPTGAVVPSAVQNINQGDQLSLLAVVSNDTPPSKGVTWSVSPAGEGTLTGAGPISVTYLAPNAVSSPMNVTITATSVTNPNAISTVQVTVLPSGAGPNVAIINVDGGPVPGQVYANGAFTSITLCNPGSTSCQTVNGILVDTGSYGLRILQSQIPLLKLPTLKDGNGNTLENCASSVDGSYLWGPVSEADIYVSGEAAPSALVQVITSANSSVPEGCSNGGTANANTPQLLGANGILGVGPEPTDCVLSGINFCDGSSQPTPPNLYFACPSIGCAVTDTPVIVTKSQQVINPVTLFTSDNNGVILQLPPVSGAEKTVAGTMVFGIGTENNNKLGSATIFNMDSNDNFTTVFQGKTLTKSFIDSGSKALYFPDSIPSCAKNDEFFCPKSTTQVSAVMEGATTGRNTVDFAVGNADDLLSTKDAAFPALAGPEGSDNTCPHAGTACSFDWGLPFFYGRNVYTAIDGSTVPGIVPPPWWAY